MLRVLVSCTYYQLLIFLRIKQAVFFTVVFPVFLFIVFGSIWNNSSKEYIPFLLSGIIGMIIASDGLYAIGPVIKEYYGNGFIKYLRKLPFNILLHFSGLILGRVITLLVIIPLLCIVSYFVFDYLISLVQFLNYIMGMLIGLFVFSFIGLILNFSNVRKGVDRSVTSFVYFLILFTGDAFYPTGEFNKIIEVIGDILPLNPILDILRDGKFTWPILFWTLGPLLIFHFTFKKFNIKR